MSLQTRTLGGTTGSPTSNFGAGTDYTSAVTPNTTGSNVTGALTGSTGVRPILITSLSVGMRTGTTTTYNIQLATAASGTGGWNGGALTGGGTKTDSPYYATYTGTTLYYGFYIQSAGTTNWYRGGSGDIYRNGTVDTNYSGTSISGSITWQTVPSAPTGISYSNVTATSADISWGAPSDTAGGVYDYRVFTYANGTYTYQGITASTSMTVTGLPSNTSVTVYVAATNEVTNQFPGAYSEPSTHTGTNASTSFTTPSNITWAEGDFAAGRVGVSYYSALRAIGSTNISFSSGSYPPGLSGSQSGEYWVVQGTPTGSGNYSISMNADGVSSGSRGITVYTPYAPSFDATNFANGKENAAYGTSTITVSNTSGLQNITTSVTNIAGLTISKTASTVSLSGTPTAAGNFSFSATAYGHTDNGTPNTTTSTLYVTIDPKTPPVWTDQTVSTTFVVDTAYSDSVAATNSPTYDVNTGSLPAGISIGGSSGALSGTPTTKQAFSFSLKAYNNDGTITTSTFSGTTSAPPVWITTTISPFLQGRSYSSGVSATSPISASPTAYAVTSGSLPVGISLNTSTGALTGIPTGSGSYSFTITASNADGSITTSPSGTILLPPNWVDNTLSSFVFNIPYTNAVSATNSPTYSVYSGALPAGISLNPATGSVTGTPTDPIDTPYSFTLRATNADGYAEQAFSGAITPDLGGKFKVYSGSSWVEGEVYVYDGTDWILGKVYTYDDPDWIKTTY